MSFWLFLWYLCPCRSMICWLSLFIDAYQLDWKEGAPLLFLVMQWPPSSFPPGIPYLRSQPSAATCSEQNCWIPHWTWVTFSKCFGQPMYKACCRIRAILHGRGLPPGVECTADCAWCNLCLFYGSACKDCEVNWFASLIIFPTLRCLGRNFLNNILLDCYLLTLIFFCPLAQLQSC